MKSTWNKLACCAFALIALCVLTCKVYGQDPAEIFKNLAPKMTASVMSDEGQVKEMEAAQQEWMTLCLQNQDLREQTNQIMLEALKADYPAVTKAWLLHILQWVGDEKCVDGIAACLTADDPRIVDEAARALAQIPEESALIALQKARDASDEPKKFQSYIDARTVDISVGVETELPLALSILSDADFDKYMADYDSFDADQKARALGAVRVRRAKKYAPVAVLALKDDNGDVKKAGLLALENTASKKDFQAIYEMFAFDRGLTVRVLQNVVADGFDQAVITAIKKEDNADNLVSLAEVVSGRSMTSEINTLLTLALKDGCPKPLELMQAAEKLATQENIPDFVNIALTVKAGAQRDRAEQVVARLCNGDATPVIKMINNQNGAQIFLLLGRIGGDAAKEKLLAGVKSNDPNMVALSIRSLCNWPNATIADQLLDFAKNKTLPEQLRIQALRAYIRVVSLPEDQDGVGMKGNDKLNALKEAFKLATRDDERNLVLDRVGSVRELDSVRFAMQYVDNPALKNKALDAILNLAHQDYLRKQDKDLFIKALDVVLEQGNDQQKDRAGNYKANIR
ncbi:MAG: HEAT repeat domain-containing protein [Planctomycetia bacterium]|nr:HEAT repeat domain-containing protein [Planctomycetia bacterium]